MNVPIPPLRSIVVQHTNAPPTPEPDPVDRFVRRSRLVRTELKAWCITIASLVILITGVRYQPHFDRAPAPRTAQEVPPPPATP